MKTNKILTMMMMMTLHSSLQHHLPINRLEASYLNYLMKTHSRPQRHACLSFVTPVKENDASIQFYFEDQGTQPTEKHIYSSFITSNTVKNDASIRLYLDNKDDVTEHYQSKLTEPVKLKTTMFYNPSAVQDTYDKDKFSSHSIDEVLNLYSYEDITGQNT